MTSLIVNEKQQVRFERGFKAMAENLAITVRKNLGSTAIDPLVPAVLANYLQVRVWTPSDVPGLSEDALTYLLSPGGDEWSALTVRVRQRDVVVLNPNHSLPRQASDLAHELSHIIRNHEPAQIIILEETGIGLRTFNDLQEAEANWLAGCLLVPRIALAHCLGRNMKKNTMQEYFGVSPELLQYRLNVTGVTKQYN